MAPIRTPAPLAAALLLAAACAGSLENPERFRGQGGGSGGASDGAGSPGAGAGGAGTSGAGSAGAPGAGGGGAAGAGGSDAAGAGGSGGDPPGDAAKGQIVYETNGCITCHGADLGGNIGPNLTPDAATGIGTRTADQIKTAVREAVGADGEPLGCGMSAFEGLSEQDLNDLVAYLRAAAAVASEAGQCND